MQTEIIFLEHETLGMKVRIARTLARWRQSDLADFADVNQAQVSAMERDAPVYPAARRRILEALGMEVGNG